MTEYINLVNLFTFEEKSVLNHNASDVSKDDFMNQMEINILASDDSDIVLMLKELKRKVTKMTEEEWESMKLYLPFDLQISDEDFDRE